MSNQQAPSTIKIIHATAQSLEEKTKATKHSERTWILPIAKWAIKETISPAEEMINQICSHFVTNDNIKLDLNRKKDLRSILRAQFKVAATEKMLITADSDDTLVNIARKLEGCVASFISVEKKEELKQASLDEAKEKNIPILIKRDAEFSLYGYKEGKWQEIPLNNLTDQEQKLLASLSFENSLIRKTNLTRPLIELLKKAHPQLEVDTDEICQNGLLTNSYHNFINTYGDSLAKKVAKKLQAQQTDELKTNIKNYAQTQGITQFNLADENLINHIANENRTISDYAKMNVTCGIINNALHLITGDNIATLDQQRLNNSEILYQKIMENIEKVSNNWTREKLITHYEKNLHPKTARDLAFFVDRFIHRIIALKNENSVDLIKKLIDNWVYDAEENLKTILVDDSFEAKWTSGYTRIICQDKEKTKTNTNIVLAGFDKKETRLKLQPGLPNPHAKKRKHGLLETLNPDASEYSYTPIKAREETTQLKNAFNLGLIPFLINNTHDEFHDEELQVVVNISSRNNSLNNQPAHITRTAKQLLGRNPTKTPIYLQINNYGTKSFFNLDLLNKSNNLELALKEATKFNSLFLADESQELIDEIKKLVFENLQEDGGLDEEKIRIQIFELARHTLNKVYELNNFDLPLTRKQFNNMLQTINNHLHQDAKNIHNIYRLPFLTRLLGSILNLICKIYYYFAFYRGAYNNLTANVAALQSNKEHYEKANLYQKIVGMNFNELRTNLITSAAVTTSIIDLRPKLELEFAKHPKKFLDEAHAQTINTSITEYSIGIIKNIKAILIDELANEKKEAAEKLANEEKEAAIKLANEKIKTPAKTKQPSGLWDWGWGLLKKAKEKLSDVANAITTVAASTLKSVLDPKEKLLDALNDLEKNLPTVNFYQQLSEPGVLEKLYPDIAKLRSDTSTANGLALFNHLMSHLNDPIKDQLQSMTPYLIVLRDKKYLAKNPAFDFKKHAALIDLSSSQYTPDILKLMRHPSGYKKFAPLLKQFSDAELKLLSNITDDSRIHAIRQFCIDIDILSDNAFSKKYLNLKVTIPLIEDLMAVVNPIIKSHEHFHSVDIKTGTLQTITPPDLIKDIPSLEKNYQPKRSSNMMDYSLTTFYFNSMQNSYKTFDDLYAKPREKQAAAFKNVADNIINPISKGLNACFLRFKEDTETKQKAVEFGELLSNLKPSKDCFSKENPTFQSFFTNAKPKDPVQTDIAPPKTTPVPA